jgi:V/A-type H+-transporting ATPase subunit A
LNSYSLYVDSITPWWNNEVGSDWRELRNTAMALLQKEAELNEIVQLVGPDALPEKDRVTLEAARMLREDFLQQNAFDDTDTYCSPNKQYNMLKTLLLYNTTAQEALADGADVNKLVNLDVRVDLDRMKYVPEDEFDAKTEELRNQITNKQLKKRLRL